MHQLQIRKSHRRLASFQCCDGNEGETTEKETDAIAFTRTSIASTTKCCCVNVIRGCSADASDVESLHDRFTCWWCFKQVHAPANRQLLIRATAAHQECVQRAADSGLPSSSGDVAMSRQGSSSSRRGQSAGGLSRKSSSSSRRGRWT